MPGWMEAGTSRGRLHEIAGCSQRTVHVRPRVLRVPVEAVANFLSGVRSELGVRLDYMTEAEAAHGYE
jgi:hypothetical protein